MLDQLIAWAKPVPANVGDGSPTPFPVSETTWHPATEPLLDDLALYGLAFLLGALLATAGLLVVRRYRRRTAQKIQP